MTPFHNIIPDCLHIVFHYYTFNVEELYLQNETDNDDNWNFLATYAHCCVLAGDGALEFISECRDMERKPSFHHLEIPASDQDVKQLFPYLRGIHTLKIRCSFEWYEDDLDEFFQNIRGIRKLILKSCPVPIKMQHLQDIRGIQDLRLHECQLPADGDCENLRGVQRLHISNSWLPLSPDAFKNLRGIQELKLMNCRCSVPFKSFSFRNLRGIRRLSVSDLSFEEEVVRDFYLTTGHLENLRGIQELMVGDRINLSQLTNESLSNLRGVTKLHLAAENPQDSITDEGMIHFRSVRNLRIHQFSHLTSNFFKNIRGVYRLEITACPNICFTARALENIRGVRYLRKRNGQNMLLNDDCLKQIRGVEELDLDGVITTSDEAFRNLGSVSDLILEGNIQHSRNVPLSEAAFSHLENVEFLTIQNMRLERVDQFSDVVFSCMPNLMHMSVLSCRTKTTALEYDAYIPISISLIQDDFKSDEGDYFLSSFEYHA